MFGYTICHAQINMSILKSSLDDLKFKQIIRDRCRKKVLDNFEQLNFEQLPNMAIYGKRNLQDNFVGLIENTDF